MNRLWFCVHTLLSIRAGLPPLAWLEMRIDDWMRAVGHAESARLS
jgi:hypothetical protein